MHPDGVHDESRQDRYAVVTEPVASSVTNAREPWNLSSASKEEKPVVVDTVPSDSWASANTPVELETGPAHDTDTTATAST